jgi:hypothetical protein
MAPTEATYDLPFGFSKAAVQVKNPSLAATIVASTGVFTTSADANRAVGDRIVLSSLTSTTGIAINTTYYVITAPSSTTFTLSATSGGSALTLTTNGSATIARLVEVRLKLANKIASNSDSKDVNYEGDNTIIKVHNTQSIGFTFDTDAFTIGAHALIFGLTEVTSSLPDSYTSAYGLFGSTAELTGQTCSFWGEAADTQTSAAGVQSTKTKRYWYPACTITASKPPELTTSDKPSSWQYTINVTNMAPTVDIMGVALPVTGAPLIVMDK